MSDTVERSLPVDLTDQEVADRAVEASKLHARFRGLQEKKKEVAAKYTAEIAEVEGQIDNLLSIVLERKEYRKVVCEVVRDYEAKTKTVIRTDTGEVVSKDPMQFNDMQCEIPEPKPDVEQSVLDVMTMEAMSMGEILNASGGEPEAVKIAVRDLIIKGKVETEGERRGKKYFLATG